MARRSPVAGHALFDALRRLDVGLATAGPRAILGDAPRQALVALGPEGATLTADVDPHHAGPLELSEERGFLGLLRSLSEVETGDPGFDARFLVRGDPSVLDEEDRRALQALPPPVRLRCDGVLLTVEVAAQADPSTAAYALVRAWDAFVPHPGVDRERPAFAPRELLGRPTGDLDGFDALAPRRSRTRARAGEARPAPTALPTQRTPRPRVQSGAVTTGSDFDPFVEEAIAALERGRAARAAADPLLAQVRLEVERFGGVAERVPRGIEARGIFSDDTRPDDARLCIEGSADGPYRVTLETPLGVHDAAGVAASAVRAEVAALLTAALRARS